MSLEIIEKIAYANKFEPKNMREDKLSTSTQWHTINEFTFLPVVASEYSIK